MFKTVIIKKPQKKLPYNIKYGVQEILSATNQFISIADKSTIIRVVHNHLYSLKKYFLMSID